MGYTCNILFILLIQTLVAMWIHIHMQYTINFYFADTDTCSYVIISTHRCSYLRTVPLTCNLTPPVTRAHSMSARRVHAHTRKYSNSHYVVRTCTLINYRTRVLGTCTLSAHA